MENNIFHRSEDSSGVGEIIRVMLFLFRFVIWPAQGITLPS
jgi:hypothetical protein